VRILCNLPLECFDDRSRFGPVELVTYGPRHRMWIDGTFHAFDVEHDPSRESVDDLLARLPGGGVPDFLLVYWPDQEPLPRGLEHSPVPVVGVVSDYNLTLPYLGGLWPFFDVLLVDRPGAELFRRLSFGDVRPFCQFSFKRRSHRLYPDVPRDVGIAFAGNLNPIVQPDRGRWLRRLLALRGEGLSVQVRTGIHGEAYGRFLASARIGFNRSVRGEMNLRAFEVPACGAMLLMERENSEVRDFFVPGEEVVLYGEEDLEEQVRRYLSDERERSRIARAGFERVQRYGMGARIQALADLLAARPGTRPAAAPYACALGRATAMLATWAPPLAPVRAFELAMTLAPPGDPRPAHGMALALLRADGAQNANEAHRLLRRAAAVDPAYLPARAALATLTGQPGDGASPCCWRDVDGPISPHPFMPEAVALSRALADAVLAGAMTEGLAAVFTAAGAPFTACRGTPARAP
jgi:hypothetical protein